MSTILYVEDYEMIRDAVVSELRDAGHAVVYFGSLKTAQKAAEPDDFDVIVVDGNIDKESDGLLWAMKLVRSGHRVVILSEAERLLIPPGIPFVDKADLDAMPQLLELVS